jgi:predicted nucleic acid-binding protein
VLANALADDGEEGDLARARLVADTSLHAPHLVDLEVVSVLRRRAASGDLDERRADLALQDLIDLPIARYPHLPFARRAWELRHNLTPYEAAYVALAETLACPFVTADARLSAVRGLSCEVEVLRARRP